MNNNFVFLVFKLEFRTLSPSLLYVHFFRINEQCTNEAYTQRQFTSKHSDTSNYDNVVDYSINDHILKEFYFLHVFIKMIEIKCIEIKSSMMYNQYLLLFLIHYMYDKIIYIQHVIFIADHRMISDDIFSTSMALRNNVISISNYFILFLLCNIFMSITIY